jgi:hypothetical protein
LSFDGGETLLNADYASGCDRRNFWLLYPAIPKNAFTTSDALKGRFALRIVSLSGCPAVPLSFDGGETLLTADYASGCEL